MTVKEMILNKGWQVLKFRDCIIQINTGLNPRQNFSLGSGNVKYITAKNLTEYGTIDFSKCDFVDEEAKRIIHRRSNIEIGDILFSSRAPIGHCHLIKEEPNYFDIGESIFSIRANQEIVSPDYLCLYLMSDYFVESASLNTTGSIIMEIRIGDLMNTEVIVPPMHIQKRIALCLDGIDRKLELNRQINDNLQHQLKLMYDYWFTQFDFPDENGKPYRASGGAMVWNEQLKCEIPQYWSIGTVSDCVEKISTGLNPRDNFVLGNGNIRYITVKNLTTTGSLDFSGCDMIDEEARAIVHRRSDIGVGDILFASIAPLGRCYLIQQQPTDWDINESVFSIRSNTDMITPEYLYLFFQSDSFIQKATNTSTGSIFKGIRINTLLDTKMIIPELQVCRSFTSAIKPLLAEINNNSAATARLTALRDWLLPMLMNGQATISD